MVNYRIFGNGRDAEVAIIATMNSRDAAMRLNMIREVFGIDLSEDVKAFRDTYYQSKQ